MYVLCGKLYIIISRDVEVDTIRGKNFWSWRGKLISLMRVLKKMLGWANRTRNATPWQWQKVTTPPDYEVLLTIP